MKNLIEKTGTGTLCIERTGTGIEKTGTGIEKTGAGIERTGTGIRVMMYAMVCAASLVSSISIAAPTINHVGALTISSSDDVVTVSWHKAVDAIHTIILGSAPLTSDAVSIPLYSVFASTGTDKVQGSGTGNANGSSLEDEISRLNLWGEIELIFNEDGSIDGIISGTSHDKGYEEFVFKAGGDLPFLMPVFENLNN